MSSTNEQTTQWLAAARKKLQNGGLHANDLNELEAALQLTKSAPPQKRQRLLYLHANGMTTNSYVIAADWREPVRGFAPPDLSPQPAIPYNTVHDAILDGWRVIHFPRQSSGVGDRELGFLGYEFILEKIEEYHD